MVSNLQLSRVAVQDGSRGMERRRAGRGAAEGKKGGRARQTDIRRRLLFALHLSVRATPSPLLPRSRSLQKVSHQHGSARAFRDPIAVLFLTLDLNERGSTVTAPLPPAGQFHGRVVVVVGFCLFPGRPFKAEHGKTNGLIFKNLTDRLMALGISFLLQVLMQCRAAAV